MNKITPTRYLFTIAILLAAMLVSCNLPEKPGPDSPGSATSLAGGETLPPPGITPLAFTATSPAPTLPIVTAAPTETEVILPTDTPVPPTATSAPPTNTPGIQPTATSAGVALTVTRIHMLNSLRGYAEGFTAGGETGLYRTDDSGKSWKLINPPAGYGDAGEFFALDAQNIWAAAGMSPPSGSSGLEYGTVYRSQDGGQSWAASQPISLATGEVALVESFFPSSLFFLNANQGWFVVSVGHYMNQDVVVILSTADGGQTWTRQTDKLQANQLGGVAMPCQVLGIAFDSATHGFMAGNCLAVSLDERWKLMESNDSGRTWNHIELGVPTNAPSAMTGPNAACAPSGLHFTAPQTYVLDYTCHHYTSDAISYHYFTYVSTNGGSSWTSAELSTAVFYGASSGIALGPREVNFDRYFYTTTNGGQSWVKGNKVTWANVALSYIDSSNGWAVVWRSNSNTGLIEYALVRTTNGDGPWGVIQAIVK